MPDQTLRQLLFLSESVGFGSSRSPGGGELFALEFLAEMLKRGWEIDVVAPPHSPLFRHPTLGARVKWHALDLSLKIKDPGFVATVVRWIVFSHRFRAHKIYGNGYATLKWLALAKYLWGAAVFCHLHESAYEAYDSPRARFLSHTVRRFFAISDMVRNLFIAGARIDPERILRVYNGVDVAPTLPLLNPDDRGAARAEIGVSRACPMVLMAARTNELKGHEVFLRAVPAVRAQIPDVMFVIVGLEARTPDEIILYDHLQSVVGHEGIRDAVRELPFRQDVRRLMSCADVVVVPSTQEGFGRTAIEAMAENTPVIASATGGLKEIIRDQVDGWFFPPGDHNVLAQRITSILTDPATAKTVARRGYESARDNYSTSRMTDLLESALLQEETAADFKRVLA